MIYPTIHLNGTDGDALYEQVSDALKAVRSAQVALLKAAPNGRDYYPAGASALTTALSEHRARLAKLNDVAEELRLMLESISDQLDARTEGVRR